MLSQLFGVHFEPRSPNIFNNSKPDMWEAEMTIEKYNEVLLSHFKMCGWNYFRPGFSLNKKMYDIYIHNEDLPEVYLNRHQDEMKHRQSSLKPSEYWVFKRNFNSYCWNHSIGSPHDFICDWAAISMFPNEETECVDIKIPYGFRKLFQIQEYTDLIIFFQSVKGDDVYISIKFEDISILAQHIRKNNKHFISK
jgi:hypothetical protein